MFRACPTDSGSQSGACLDTVLSLLAKSMPNSRITSFPIPSVFSKGKQEHSVLLRQTAFRDVVRQACFRFG